MQTFKDRRFLASCEIPLQLLEKAERLREKENFLFDIVSANDLNEAIQLALALNITASYEIENEYLDSEIVKSYVMNSMGMKVSDWMETDWTGNDEENDFIPKEQRAVEAIMSCLNTEPLSHEMIWKTNSLSCGFDIRAYRDHPEVVRAGSRIIYRAPEAELVPCLMDSFLDWWHDDRLNLPPSIGAAIAHYNFVAIHPFKDGNGRTSRALAEKALITSQETVFRPYSLSTQILDKRLDYYAALRTGDPFIFIRYILDVHDKAIDHGISEARRLDFLRLYFRRDEFSRPEKEIIQKMSLYPNYKWKADDFYLVKDSEMIFQTLQNKRVINDSGQLNIDYRPAQINFKP